MRVFFVPLLADDDDGVALESAAALAGRAGGAVFGLFVRPDPTEVLSTLVEGASPSTIRSVTRAASDGLEERSRRVRGALERAAAGGGLDERRARLVETVGDVSTSVAAHGRLGDVTVLAGDIESNGNRRRVFEAALFHAVRPVLLLREPLEAPPSTFAVAWNGSPEAARAVQAALPWLAAAEEVHVLGAGSPRHEPANPRALADYLQVHGIGVSCHDLDGAGGVGQALLAKAKALGAGCMVMGGYGRSRMQEMIFGGATRHVLTHRDRALLVAH